MVRSDNSKGSCWRGVVGESGKPLVVAIHEDNQGSEIMKRTRPHRFAKRVALRLIDVRNPRTFYDMGGKGAASMRRL
jgi:hypothetical protein